MSDSIENGPDTNRQGKPQEQPEKKSAAQQIGHWFDILAQYAARGMGHPVTFSIALLSVIVWAASGPFLGFSEDWQLVINTGTTICTFLMVFLIQHTQNRDSAAMHLKIDELLRALEGARNSAIMLEELDEAELLKLQKEYHQIAQSGGCSGSQSDAQATAEATVRASRKREPQKSGSEADSRKPDLVAREQG